ncbi:hypothetical protein [Simkania sp.]|uniref:hypothetical protein n=1 Tax=Simkania sp. TaxID=34094 RepID=UPI003B51F985
MSFLRLVEASKISIHWDHLLSPNDPNSGKELDTSWTGIAKKVAGLILFAFSCGLIGFKSSSLLFGVGGSYHFYQAYQKAQVIQPDSSQSGETNKPDEVSHEDNTTYNESGIEAIHKASEAGKKIGLIIGREFSQPVPKEEGWLWVTLNIDGSPREPSESRIDLKMDFNEVEKVQQIEKLFNRVVVDWSTLKFLHDGPWHRCKDLLKPEETSQMIVETHGTVALKTESLRRELQENQQKYDEWKSGCSEEEIEKEKKAFFEQMSLEKKEQIEKNPTYLDQAFVQHILDKHYPDRYSASKEAAIIRHGLKSLFNCVELFHKTLFPTREGDGIVPIEGNYFVLTGPTERSRERVKKFEIPRCIFHLR